MIESLQCNFQDMFIECYRKYDNPYTGFNIEIVKKHAKLKKIVYLLILLMDSYGINLKKLIVFDADSSAVTFLLESYVLFL